MDPEVKASRARFIFFILILSLDWYYIYAIQNQAAIINHWVIALPIIIPLFVALSLLALIGIYISNLWGYVLAYFTIIFSMYFAFISYQSIPLKTFTIDFRFVLLSVLNTAVFFYILFYHLYLAVHHEDKNNQ